MALGKIKRKY